MNNKIQYDYHYGINTRKITTDEERLRNFIESQPAVKAQLIEWERTEVYGYDYEHAKYAYETDSAKELCELYMDHGDNDDIDGFAGIIQMVLSASTGVPLTAYRDLDTDDCFVVLSSCYPWEINDAFLKIKTENDVKALFKKNLAILTDQTLDELDWGKQGLENQ